MLHDGESSEEDEVLEPTIGKKRDNDGNFLPTAEITKPSTVLISTAMDEEEEEDEPIQGSTALVVPTITASSIPQQDNFENDNKVATSSSSLGVLGGTYYESEEFSESLASVNDDPWDVSSWQVMMEEVLSGRGGERTFPQICLQFLEQFPRAAKTYERLADFYLNEGRLEEAYALLKKGCRSCWNIDLWAYYLDLMKRKFAELQRVPQTEEMQKDRAAAELEFQAAIESMGWSVDAFALWRVYLDFQKVYPELSALDLAQKTANIRKVFHKAVMMTFEQMDTIWGEFEQFERQQQGENNPQCEQYLDDWKKKFLHAKSFLRDRRRLTDRLDVDRLAVPPSGGNSSVQQQESQQLDMWSTFLSYEMDNFDAANPDAYRPTVHMAFQQCLSCFLHYPEVWIAFAQFEHAQQQARDAKEQDKMLLLDRDIFAKGLLDEAIRHNPQSSILRIALAEIEESVGRVDAVLRILKDMFVAQPDGFTFTIYQRFVRRQAGLVAARKLFSETNALRGSLPAEQALQLYLAHATLEWQVNHAVDVSRRCLDLCKEKLGLTVCLRSAAYLSLSVGVLGQLGERDALRWLLTAALEDAASSFTSLTATSSAANSSVTGAGSVFEAEIAQLQRQVELLEMFLQSELRLNSADRAHLEYLRDRRHVTKTLLDERVSVAAGTHATSSSSGNKGDKSDKEGTSGAASGGAVSKLSAKLTSLMSNVHGYGHPLLAGSGGGAASSMLTAAGGGVAAATNVRRSIFDATYELFERYDTMSTGVTAVSSSSTSSSGPKTDGDLRDRIRGKSALDPQYHTLQLQQQQLQQLQQLQSHMDRGENSSGGRANRGGQNAVSAVVPQLLKDFAGKLPPHVGALPDFDAFCRHIRSVVLPPRPNGPAPGTYKASFSSGGGMTEETNGVDSYAMDTEDEAKKNYMNNNNNANDNDVSGSMAVDDDNDVFRQRHRQQ